MDTVPRPYHPFPHYNRAMTTGPSTYDTPTHSELNGFVNLQTGLSH